MTISSAVSVVKIAREALRVTWGEWDVAPLDERAPQAIELLLIMIEGFNLGASHPGEDP